MTQNVWLSNHPYLKPVSELHIQVKAAVDEVPAAADPVFNWSNYLDDFHRGVPLLHSSAVTIDLTPAGMMLQSIVKSLASSLAGNLAEQTRAVAAELHQDPDAPAHVVAWLLGKETFVSACPGLLQFFGWTALARYLARMGNVYAGWREEERWLRNYCPTCGSPPGLAQLVGTDPGRRRFLVCGFCGTRWQYRRTECPFCQSQDDHRLAILAVEGEGGLRIDYCESCHGYLKTYDGEGSESVLLADWNSIHLDVVAVDRGLKRLAASLYEI